MSYQEQREAAEAAARSLFQKLRTCGKPVDLDRIARFLDIEIQMIPLDDELSGMAFVRDGKSIIVVNAYHHRNRQRFTIAHEIAHHVLHSADLREAVHVDKAILNRNARSTTGEDVNEVQANAFAAELLMPKSELRKLGTIDVNDDDRIATLAREFRVSPAAMAIRVDNLLPRS